MRTEVIKADSIDEAAEQILDELKEDPATTARSISSRNNVIYFDGWDGLGASAVLRAVAQRLTAMASSDEAPAGLQFDQIIHIDCSKWESRRSLQRAVAEKLELPAQMMEMFDTQAEEDDFNGIAEGSRTEIPQVLRAMFQCIQEQNRRFLVIFHNGSTEEIDLAIFGFLLFGYSTNKVLWTFQGKLRLQPRMKVVKIIEATGKTDVFLSASPRPQEDPRKFWSFLVHQEATEVATSLVDNNTGAGRGIVDQPSQVVECFLYMLKLCCLRYHFNMVGGYDYDMATHSCNYWMCDAIISRQEGQGEATDGGDASWQAADALRLAMPFDVDDHPYMTPSHLVTWGNDNRTTSQNETPFSSPSYWHLPVPASAIPNADMFQNFDKLSVLKLYGRTFILSSPPFINCHNLKFLWLDHCQVQDTAGTDTAGGDPEEEAMIRRCFQNLWVLDVRYTRCDGILSSRLLDFMTQLRELNVEGAQDWDIGQLQGRLPNIRKLRVTKSTVGCTSCLENNLTLGMNKMELLEFSGNRTMQGGVARNLSGISTSSNELETVIIVDGCVGIQKFSLRGCAKLKNLLLSGLFEDLRILDLSGTTVKTLDVSAMTAPSLDELFLNDCQNLCAILFTPEDKRKRNLQKLHIDTTWSAASSTPTKENSTEDSSTTAGITTTSSPSSSLSAVHGGTAPSAFNWCIRARDGRILRSLAPFKQYFNDNVFVHVEIYSPAASFSSGNDNKASSSNCSIKQQHVPLVKVDKPTDSFVYADVEVTFKDHQLVQPSEGDAPTMLTQIWPCPRIPSHSFMKCYTHIQDHELSTKSLPGVEQTMTSTLIPDMICRNAYIMHVHDSLSITSIPGPAPTLGSTWFFLEWCRVERCPKLEHAFTAPQQASGHVLVFNWLKIFWASELSKACCIWNWAPPSVLQFEELSFVSFQLLHMDLCPRVIHVLPLALEMVDNKSLHNLEALEIMWCGDLREVFPLYTKDAKNEQQQQQSPTTTVRFRCLKRIHLHELPKLQGICGGWRISAPELETVKIRGCWSLKRLPAVGNNTSKKVECDCEKEWWDKLEWDGLDANHDPSLYKATHSRYYKKTQLKGSVLR